MPVSPQDFQLWASLTGNRYPGSPQERAALAPEVYNFTRNLGRKGGVRDLSGISHDQPEAFDHPNPDSLIQAPVTPDNSMPKVAGTHDQSLTSQHYENEQADHAAEQSKFRRAVDIVGKTALVAGGVAGTVALARNPTVQRAAQEAAGAVKTHIGDVGSRVSDFLGGFMGSERTPGTQVAETSGDVTPPTTAQRYLQGTVPTQTRLLQAASGAPPQAEAKDIISKGFGTNAPTIATSQSFSPQPRIPLDIAGTSAGNANFYRPQLDTSLLAKPENIVYSKGAEYVPDIPNPLHPSLQRATPEVIEARRQTQLAKPLPTVYAPGEQPISSATKDWSRQTKTPADFGYTHTADPFTGEYTPRVNEPWTGEGTIAERTQNFLSELQQTKTTNLLPPSQSIADVTAGGPIGMPQLEKDINFDQQTSNIGVPRSTPISNYDPVNISSLQEKLAPWRRGTTEWTGIPSSLETPGEYRIHSNLGRALNLAATTGDYSLLAQALPKTAGQRYGGRDVEDLTTNVYAGMSPAGTNVLENLPTSKFFVDISNIKKLPYEVGVTGMEGSIPAYIEQKAIESGELGISDPRLAKAGSQIKFLRGEEIAASNKKSAAGKAYEEAVQIKRSQLRDPREIAAFEAAPHLHPSIAPYADQLAQAEIAHSNVQNQLEGSLVPYESIRGNKLQMRVGGKVQRTEADLPALGLMRAGKEGPRGFTFTTHPAFQTEQNPLGIYAAEPRQAYKGMYPSELYQTAAETEANIGFKGLGRGEISPSQIMVTASGKGYRARPEEGVNPASIVNPLLAQEQPWLKTPEGLTYVQRALTPSAEFTPRKERKAALDLLQKTHELNAQAKELKAKGDFAGASDLLMESVRLKKGVNEEIGYGRRHPEGYEVSSLGDKRFSAMYAQLPSGQTIETAYQTLKGTGKGKPALDPNFDYWGTYKGLWNEFFNANPDALNEIAEKSSGKVLTDRFANTANNQARAIHEILVERGLRSNMLPKTNLRGTPEQGAQIALQMELERNIKAGLGPKVSLPQTSLTDTATSSLYPLNDPRVNIRPAGETEEYISAAATTPKLSAQKQSQQRQTLERNKQNEIKLQQQLLEQARQNQIERERIKQAPSGGQAAMLTGPEISRRVTSGYEAPRAAMSEPYNPRLGTRVTNLVQNVLSQYAGPGVTLPSQRQEPLERYRQQAVPTRTVATQMSIPGTEAAASTPVQVDPHIQQLAAYMARRAEQLPGRFTYAEPAKQLGLRF